MLRIGQPTTCMSAYNPLYLVAFEKGGRFLGSKLLGRGVNRGDATILEQHAFLRKLMPGYGWCAPIDKLPSWWVADPKSLRYVTVWLSPSADGSTGRAGGTFHEWVARLVKPSLAQATEGQLDPQVFYIES